MVLPQRLQLVGKSLINLCTKRNIYRTGFNFCDEETKAKKAAKESREGTDTIFDKIIRKEIPADIIYEDGKCLAFKDVAPKAPVHFLVVPKVKIDMLENAKETDTEVL